MVKTFKPTEDNFKILGRTETIDDILYINYSCSGIEFEFTVSRLDRHYVQIVILTRYSQSLCSCTYK